MERNLSERIDTSKPQPSDNTFGFQLSLVLEANRVKQSMHMVLEIFIYQRTSGSEATASSKTTIILQRHKDCGFSK